MPRSASEWGLNELPGDDQKEGSRRSQGSMQQAIRDAQSDNALNAPRSSASRRTLLRRALVFAGWARRRATDFRQISV
jgi:hypothetical protein